MKKLLLAMLLAFLMNNAFCKTTSPMEFSGVSQNLNLYTSLFADTEPPSVPTGLIASNVTETSFTLSWNRSTDNVGIAFYEIYQNGGWLGGTADTSFNIVGISSTLTYTFKVAAYDAAGNSSGTGAPLVIGTVDTQAPSIPQNLMASEITANSVKLSWDASTDNNGTPAYQYYMNDQWVGGTSDLFKIVTGLTCGTTYAFTVDAFDGASPANISAQSSPVSVTTLACTVIDTEPPTVPTGLVASNITETTVDLSWNASTDNVSLHGYQVYINGNWYNGTVDLTMTVSGLTKGTTYNFTVDAFDWAVPVNVSAPTAPLSVTTSGSVGADTEPPTTPTGLTASNITETTVDLSWNASTDNVSLHGYQVYINGAWYNGTVDLTMTVSGLTKGTTYSFTVDAFDWAVPVNVSAASAPLSVTTTGGTGPGSDAPTVPVGLAATNITETSFDLSWSASTDNDGVGGYKIYKNEVYIGTTAGLTLNVSGLLKGVPYHFNVVAFDVSVPAHYSAASANFFVTTAGIPDQDKQAPSVPTGLQATEITENSFVMSWNPSTDNVVVHGYEIFKDNNYYGSTVDTTFLISGLAKGRTYSFTLDAIDAFPHNVSAKSLPLSVTTLSPVDNEAPTVPVGLTATNLTQNSMTLSWTKSTDNVLTRGYNIYKDSDFLLSTTRNSYEITDLTCETAYVFTVEAFDGATVPNVSAKSEPLNVATTRCIDTEAPSVPVGLMASGLTDTSFVLSWTASTDNVGVGGYNVYQNGVFANSTNGLEMSITGLKKGANYMYTIVAFDVSEPANHSAASANFFVTTTGIADPDTEAPSVPTGITASDITETSCTLSWNASSDNVSVHGYQVYKDGAYLGGTVELSMSITGLTKGTSYNFTVDAFDWSVPANISPASVPLNVTTLSPPVVEKFVINWPQSAVSGAPANLINDWDYIETLPFNGVVIFTPEFRDAMTSKILTYKQVFTDSKLGELSERFVKVKNNFLMVWAAPPPLDAFKDWDQYLANLSVFAKAAHDAGCLGIIFEDEQYYKDYSKPDGAGGIWEYPLDVEYSGTYTIEDYREQMRMRGNQIMTAMIAQFPDIQVLFPHGPYWSEPQAFIDLPRLNDQIPAYIQGEKMLLGSLFAGFVEASVTAKAQGHSPKVIDGGEIYSMRTKQEYEQKYYTWRKNTIASASVNSLSIPESLRPDWPANVSISYGLFNGWGMTPAILRNSVEYSLRGADDCIWYYSEGQEWYVPGAVSQDWIDAIKNGTEAGLQPTVLATSILVTGADNATTITTKDGTLQMSVAFTPENTSSKNVLWSVTNGTGKAKINQTGLLTATADGTVTVKALATDGSNVKGQLVITISNQVITSVSEPNANILSIYPNPLSKGMLTIDFGKEVSGIVSFFDVSGKLVLTKNIKNTENTQIESGMLPKGVLIVKAFVAGNMKVSKLIVE